MNIIEIERNISRCRPVIIIFDLNLICAFSPNNELEHFSSQNEEKRQLSGRSRIYFIAHVIICLLLVTGIVRITNLN